MVDRVKGALAFANQIRKNLGKPPVENIYRGERSNGYSCPITNTIYDDDDFIDSYIVWTGPDETVIWPRQPNTFWKTDDYAVGAHDVGQLKPYFKVDDIVYQYPSSIDSWHDGDPIGTAWVNGDAYGPDSDGIELTAISEIKLTEEAENFVNGFDSGFIEQSAFAPANEKR